MLETPKVEFDEPTRRTRARGVHHLLLMHKHDNSAGLLDLLELLTEEKFFARSEPVALV